MAAPKTFPQPKPPMKQASKTQRGMPTKQKPETSRNKVMRKKG